MKNIGEGQRIRSVMDNYKDRWQWFKYDDFQCKCGCGQNRTDPVFIDMLDVARSESGVPFVINSGHRCDAHNRSVGSTSENHVSGEAADIRCSDGVTRMRIIVGLIKAGFRRIGFHHAFIHADRMDQVCGRVQSFWPY